MPRPDSIRAIGIEPYLNQTAHKHGGLDFNVFRRMIEAGASYTSIGRSFNVQPNIVRKWEAVYREEQAKKANV